LIIGLDTGFFIELLRGNKKTVKIWQSFIEGEDEAVCSALTIFELERLALKGAVDKKAIEAMTEAIFTMCLIVWIDNKELLLSAAKKGHGLGLSAVDAIILASFLFMNCKEIYSTDSDFETYRRKGIKVINLKKKVIFQ